MNIATTKTYTNVPLEELKEHLNFESSDTDYDSKLQRLIKAAVGSVEKDIGQDIAITTATLTDYCVHSSCYEIYEPGLTINSISATTSTGIVTAITGYTVYNFSSYTHIKFNTSVNAETLQITYTSGMAEIPEDLKTAIFIKAGELLNDVDGYTTNNVKETKAYRRIIAHYTNLL